MIRELLTLTILCLPVLLAGDPPPALRNITVKQRFGSQLPLDAEFWDDAGQRTSLRALSRGRPILLTPVYYSCPRLCSLILSGALKAMQQMPLTAGKDFDVVTLSFDPREGPELARRKRATYLAAYGRPQAAEGWRFLTGGSHEIRRVLDAAGYGFEFDAMTEQFAHPSAVIVLTPRGKVSRYLYGVDFSPQDLRLALLEAGEGKVGEFTDQVLLYCFRYDAQSGRYSMAVLRLVRLAAAGCAVALVAAIFWVLRRERARKAVPV